MYASAVELFFLLEEEDRLLDEEVLIVTAMIKKKSIGYTLLIKIEAIKVLLEVSYTTRFHGGTKTKFTARNPKRT